MFCLYDYAVLISNNKYILAFYACAMIQQSYCKQIDQLVLVGFKVISLVNKGLTIVNVRVLGYWISLLVCLLLNAVIPVSIKY